MLYHIFILSSVIAWKKEEYRNDYTNKSRIQWCKTFSRRILRKHNQGRYFSDHQIEHKQQSNPFFSPSPLRKQLWTLGVVVNRLTQEQAQDLAKNPGMGIKFDPYGEEQHFFFYLQRLNYPQCRLFRSKKYYMRPALTIR